MFTRARLKLTTWYLLIIMVVSVSFSFVIFRVTTTEVERFDRLQRFRIENRFGFPSPSEYIDSSLVQDTEQRIFIILAIINSAILVIAGTGGYFLSGITLSPIKEMLDEQNRFISDASHEINTPLTSLKTAMEVFQRSKNKNLKEANNLVDENIAELNKLQSLTSSLLELAQYEEPNGHSKLSTLSLADTLSEAIKNIKSAAEVKNIKIQVNVDKFSVTGNSYALTDLFTIILDNAVKYSPENSTVLVNAKKQNKNVVIKFKDHGIGIGAKDIPHIFDRFYRADEARSKFGSKGGYGLGLAIAKKIVETHHGTISVSSTQGKGSEFTVTLPS